MKEYPAFLSQIRHLICDPACMILSSFAVRSLRFSVLQSPALVFNQLSLMPASQVYGLTSFFSTGLSQAGNTVTHLRTSSDACRRELWSTDVNSHVRASGFKFSGLVAC
jgi:hypothetical protein